MAEDAARYNLSDLEEILPDAGPRLFPVSRMGHGTAGGAQNLLAEPSELRVMVPFQELIDALIECPHHQQGARVAARCRAGESWML